MITDVINNVVHTPQVLDSFCSCGVPEPTSGALLGLGALVMLGIRRLNTR